MEFDQLWVASGKGSDPRKGKPTLMKKVKKVNRLLILRQHPRDLQYKKLGEELFVFVVVIRK